MIMMTHLFWLMVKSISIMISDIRSLTMIQPKTVAVAMMNIRRDVVKTDSARILGSSLDGKFPVDQTENDRIGHGDGPCLRGVKDSDHDTAQDDDRGEKGQDALFEAFPDFSPARFLFSGEILLDGRVVNQRH